MSVIHGRRLLLPGAQARHAFRRAGARARGRYLIR